MQITFKYVSYKNLVHKQLFQGSKNGLCDIPCILYSVMAVSDMLKEMVLTFQSESLQIIVPMLLNGHSTFQDNPMPSKGTVF